MSKRMKKIEISNSEYRILRCDCLVSAGFGPVYFVQSVDDPSRVLSLSTSLEAAGEICGGLNSIEKLSAALDERHGLLSDARKFMLNSHREATYSLTAAEVGELERLKAAIYAALQMNSVEADLAIHVCDGSHQRRKVAEELTSEEKSINEFANILRRVSGR